MAVKLLKEIRALDLSLTQQPVSEFFALHALYEEQSV